MLVVGLTGGIGSGKTTIARFFQLLGVSVYYADDRARMLVNKNSILKEKIIEAFGSEAYLNHEYNRAYIGKLVFENKQKLVILNSIIHPAVAKDFDDWKATQKGNYIIKEAAILFESGTYKSCDRIITVTAPLEEKISRVVNRDGITYQEVLNRINKQMSDEQKIARSNYVLNNDNHHLLIPQIISIHEDIISSTNKGSR